MKIDYVVISSDSNPLYTDFYVPVSKAWNHFGYKTFMIEICDEDSEVFETDYGIYKKIKSVINNNGLQAQVSRLYAANLLDNKNILTSDIDMMPMSIKYFEDRAGGVSDDQILIYSGQPYKVNPFYPMCYVLSNSNILSNALGITDLSFVEFVDYLCENYKGDNVYVDGGTIWNTDENFMYDKLSKVDNKIVLTDRDFSKRINRTNRYDVDKLKGGYYIDSHLLRPYNQYKNEVDKLLNLILNK
jgi:hypothetical protein